MHGQKQTLLVITHTRQRLDGDASGKMLDQRRYAMTPYEVMPVKKSVVQPLLNAAHIMYHGRKIKVKFTTTVTFYDTNWSGGTRNQYTGVKGDGSSLTYQAPAPWVNPVEGKTFELTPDIIVIEHSVFCGKDLGLTIFVHPSYLPKWLPEKIA
jgi:hypothetical protein